MKSLRIFIVRIGAQMLALATVMLTACGGGGGSTTGSTTGSPSVTSGTNGPVITSALATNPSVPTTAGPTEISMACQSTNGGAVSYTFDPGDGSEPTSNQTGMISYLYGQNGLSLSGQYEIKAECTQQGGAVRVQKTLLVEVKIPNISTLAGGANTLRNNSIDGLGVNAAFFSVLGVTLDSNGNAFVADNWNNTIRKVTSEGMVSTIAGLPRGSVLNPFTNGFSDGLGTNARFDHPTDIAIDKNGVLYVADQYNNAIRKINQFGSVSTLAGSANSDIKYADGIGINARFNLPSGVAVDEFGNVFVADTKNYLIRKITPNGNVSTLAGSISTNVVKDGAGSEAGFSNPTGLTVNIDGNIYVVDVHTVRKITKAGVVTTFAGSPFDPVGEQDGVGTSARFSSLVSITHDELGNLYVADSQSIRKITLAGSVTTVAGSFTAASSLSQISGPWRYHPSGVAINKGRRLVFTYDDLYVGQIDFLP